GHFFCFSKVSYDMVLNVSHTVNNTNKCHVNKYDDEKAETSTSHARASDSPSVVAHVASSGQHLTTTVLPVASSPTPTKDDSEDSGKNLCETLYLLNIQNETE